MKTILLLLVSLSVILGACTTEDEMISPLWGIDFSTENVAGFATGTVDRFEAETKTTYIVKAANLRCAGGNIYKLSYNFESGDIMEITLAKRTAENNFLFPGNSGENQLLSATFNSEMLDLTHESKISVQPREGENKLATVTRLQTLGHRLYDGAIGRVPLLK